MMRTSIQSWGMMTLSIWLLVGIIQAQAPGADSLEKCVLFDPETARSWYAAESTVESSPAHVKAGNAALLWHVTVDYFTGEAKYPIGWPRIIRAIPDGPLRDWSAWDYLRMWVFTETSHASLPREPVGLGLYTPDWDSAYHRALTELRKGEWVEIRIPTAQIPRVSDVRRMQFHISESNYKHGDTLDLFIDDLALLRYARPTLLEFAAETPVLFADAHWIPVTFQLMGLKHGEQVAVNFELWRDGRLTLRRSVEAARGSQRVALDLGHAHLRPGSYELAAHTGDQEPVTSTLRVVESPWR